MHILPPSNPGTRLSCNGDQRLRLDKTGGKKSTAIPPVSTTETSHCGDYTDMIHLADSAPVHKRYMLGVVVAFMTGTNIKVIQPGKNITNGKNTTG